MEFRFTTFLFLLSLSTFSSSSLSIPSPKLKNKPTPNLFTPQQFLYTHNVIRSKLKLPPLKWSKKLANFASSWARKRKNDCELIHSDSDYGENLFWGSGGDWKPNDAVKRWAAEKKYYNYKENKCSENRECLHYTQIVWRQSLRVGCAKVLCKSGDTFIVCNYDPHGNVVGQKPF